MVPFRSKLGVTRSNLVDNYKKIFFLIIWNFYTKCDILVVLRFEFCIFGLSSDAFYGNFKIVVFFLYIFDKKYHTHCYKLYRYRIVSLRYQLDVKLDIFMKGLKINWTFLSDTSDNSMEKNVGRLPVLLYYKYISYSQYNVCL